MTNTKTLRFKMPMLILAGLLFYTFSNMLLAQNTESPERSMTGFEAADAPQPLWEYGVGGGAVDVPNYPGSSERNFVALALPYIVYRGDILRIGGGNARAVVAENRNMEFDISVAGAFAADSEENSAREGMPDLDTMFEVGPQIVYRLKDFNFAQNSKNSKAGKGRLNLRLPLRSVFSTDFEGLNNRGFVFQPELTYQQRGVLFKEVAFGASLSLVFATEKLHDYFYQVDSTFANDNRQVFDASGGYMGAELSVGMSFPVYEHIRGFAGGTVNFLQGAANQDSPLFEDDITYSFGVGFIWRLGKSERMANW